MGDVQCWVPCLSTGQPWVRPRLLGAMCCWHGLTRTSKTTALPWTCRNCVSACCLVLQCPACIVCNFWENWPETSWNILKPSKISTAELCIRFNTLTILNTLRIFLIHDLAVAVHTYETQTTRFRSRNLQVLVPRPLGCRQHNNASTIHGSAEPQLSAQDVLSQSPECLCTLYVFKDARSAQHEYSRTLEAWNSDKKWTTWQHLEISRYYLRNKSLQSALLRCSTSLLHQSKKLCRVASWNILNCIMSSKALIS